MHLSKPEEQEIDLISYVQCKWTEKVLNYLSSWALLDSLLALWESAWIHSIILTSGEEKKEKVYLAFLTDASIQNQRPRRNTHTDKRMRWDLILSCFRINQWCFALHAYLSRVLQRKKFFACFRFDLIDAKADKANWVSSKGILNYTISCFRKQIWVKGEPRAC